MQARLSVGMFLMVVIAQMITEDTATRYGLMMVIINVMYTFYRVVKAIVGIMKSRKLKSSIIAAAKSINFMAALGSRFFRIRT